MNPDDSTVVASQLGREPRGRWRVAQRCAHGLPAVIAMEPLLEDGTPFPTTFWLTCPSLVSAVHDLESAGEGALFADRIAAEPGLAAALADGDAAYREARRLEGHGIDPCEGVGVAGQRDPLAVKCLHARLAAHLAGVPDPLGEAVAEMVRDRFREPCDEPRCRAHVGPGC